MSEPARKPSWKDRLSGAFDAAKKKGAELAGAAAKTGKSVYDDAAKQGKETLETLNVLVTDENRKPETLQDRAEIVKDHLSKTEWLEVAKDTAQELTKKDELKRLAGTVIALPGGLAVYGAYRVAKHRKEKLEEESNARKAPKTRKGPKAG